MGTVHVSDFLTILVLVGLEGLLSADNAIVLAILVLGLPKRQHHQALQYGLIGAFGFRIVTTTLAAYLIRLTVVKLVGAAYLLYLVTRHFFRSGGANERRQTPTARSWLGLSPFWATVVKVELTNLAFSLDSILVAVAMSPRLWVVLAGGLLGIVMMRIVIGQLIAIVQRYPALVDGAFIIIAWVGLKLLLEYLHGLGLVTFDVPRWFSLGLILMIFSIACFYARREQHPLDDRAARFLAGKDE